MRRNEIENFRFESERFTIIEEPSEECLGSFSMRLEPNVGDSKKYCYIELEVHYLNDEQECEFDLPLDKAHGLDTE